MKKSTGAFSFLIVAALAITGSARAARPRPAPLLAPPDLTKGETTGIDRRLTYNLGATGLRGWIYTRPVRQFDFESLQGRTTTPSRQILVTHVGAKSPADGVMQVDDVILGAGGKLFTDDARKSIAVAIQEAEKESSDGILKLTIWRPIDSAQGKAGKAEEVQIKLRVMGAYSETAPYDCPKSKRIFDEACKVLEKEPLEGDLWGAINGLALMATGKADYLPRVKEFARKIGPPDMKLVLDRGSSVWDWGYKNLFLCEYYLLTGDREVLHAINEYTICLAKGQSLYGTCGHGIAPPGPDGTLHGSIPPYGPVNAAGLVGNIAIVMGKKCGVKDREIDPAIERASKFFGYFVDKGAIPYGEHLPWPYHENNGKNAMAATLFAVQGNRPVETQFFARMVTASSKNRESGHTGQGFSYLWGALGANAGGPDAASAFFKEASWHFDLVRRCDGSFTYDGQEQFGPGRTDDNTYYGRSSYCGLSPTASYVLTYSLPLKKLHITGKDANQGNRLSKKDVAEAVASGRFDLDRKDKSAKELVAAFGDWSPIVRSWAAEELASRPEAKAMVPELITMAEGKDAHIRQGACEALGYIKNADALPVLVRLLTHEDRWLRVKAANALKRLADSARPAIPEMLKAVVKNAEPCQPVVWADPVQIGQCELAITLFGDRGGLLRDSIKGIDPELLYPAIRAIAKCSDGMGRFQLEKTLSDLLTLDDAQVLAPDIIAAIYNSSPADTMFVDTFRLAALKVLTKHHFKEGISACAYYAKNQDPWQSESRTGKIMKELIGYGTAARSTVPELKELLARFRATPTSQFPTDCNNMRIASLEDAIKAIEAATTQPELRSIAPEQPKRSSNK
jgi:hypothetical protein